MRSGLTTLATVSGHRRLGSFAFTLVLFMMAAPSALADANGKPVHQPFDVTFPDPECGIVVNAHNYGVLNIWATLDDAGQIHRKFTGSGTAVYTNPANGKTLIEHSAGRMEVSNVVGVSDRIYRTTIQSGLTIQLKASGGTIVTKDVGRLVVVVTGDDNGTPLDPIDDTVISIATTFEAGPHPDLDAGGNVFFSCAEFLSALT